MSVNQRTIQTIAFATVTFVAVLCTPQAGRAQDAKNPYPSMAPLDQYLMDRDVEIALARSSAPPSIAKDATVLVLTKNGYETVVKGTNGFVCMVGRTWTDGFDRPEFWNPKNRGPACYNPQAARSVLPIDLMRTNFALAGQTKEEIHESMKAAIAKGELPALEPGAMIYMLSKQQRINDSAGHWHPHLMFYVPLGAAKTWGADAPDSPIFVTPRFNGAPEPLTELVIVVPEWSDGTPADDHAH
jgi:hypothetical protein